jgi:anthranilate phosphoribosyltransferase
MKKVLNILFEHRTLTREESKNVLLDIGKGIYNEHELSAFMTVYLMRSISMPELLGFRDALLEMCIPIDLEDRKTIDIVGTGGDGKNTFNISTLSCFIVAGAGQPVAKHGSYGASSVSGASNLMAHIGYTFKNEEDQLRKELDQTNMCFLHAPMFHPALKVVAPIRKNLKVRTFFNMLGPMVNPSSPEYNMVGVYNLEMARIYSYLFQSQQKKFMIINSLDGYDEISLTSDTKIITEEGEKIMSPIQLANCLVSPEQLYGGDSVEEASTIFLNILQNKGTMEQTAVVLSNAALALQLTEKYSSYQDAYEAAKESLESGKAMETMKKLISIQ